MTKRYMDFAPVKNGGGVRPARGGVDAKKPVSASRTTNTTRTVRAAVPKKSVARVSAATQGVRVRRPVTKTPKTTTVSRAAVAKTQVVMERSERAARGGLMMESKMGVVEELNPHFVTTNVSKRPLSRGMSGVDTDSAGNGIASDREIANVKSKKIGAKLRGRRAASKAVVGSRKKVARAKESYANYAVPTSPFINQDKVEKRPLSKNVYQSNTVLANKAKKTEGKKPVTIIAKPEKDSHVGMIVTIILTIILGAVAGTVAFLLLPK